MKNFIREVWSLEMLQFIHPLSHDESPAAVRQRIPFLGLYDALPPVQRQLPPPRDLRIAAS